MEKITIETKLADILAEYPWLKEKMSEINPKFKMLSSPVGKIMMGKATIGEMGKRSGMDVASIIGKLEELIQKHQN